MHELFFGFDAEEQVGLNLCIQSPQAAKCSTGFYRDPIYLFSAVTCIIAPTFCRAASQTMDDMG